jgi:hypothetical protein
MLKSCFFLEMDRADDHEFSPWKGQAKGGQSFVGSAIGTGLSQKKGYRMVGLDL